MSPHAAALETLSVNGRHVISAREAARRSGWSQNYISILCRTGELVGVRLATGWLVDELALEELLEERARKRAHQREELRAQRRMEYLLNTRGVAA